MYIVRMFFNGRLQFRHAGTLLSLNHGQRPPAVDLVVYTLLLLWKWGRRGESVYSSKVCETCCTPNLRVIVVNFACFALSAASIVTRCASAWQRKGQTSSAPRLDSNNPLVHSIYPTGSTPHTSPTSVVYHLSPHLRTAVHHNKPASAPNLPETAGSRSPMPDLPHLRPRARTGRLGATSSLGPSPPLDWPSFLGGFLPPPK